MNLPGAVAVGLSLAGKLCLVPVLCGSVYAILCLIAVVRFLARPPSSAAVQFSSWPPVTILKPVCGLEKNLRENLASACRQDYLEFQVVLSVQRSDDPAIPVLRDLQREFGGDRVAVAVTDRQAGTNGKVNNLLGALDLARHDILVISDADTHLRPDYLKTIVAPLADPGIGFVCTLYKAAGADNLFEKAELLTLNAELVPDMIFARVTGACEFLIGASVALRRSTLEKIGGLEPFADDLVEDYRLGRSICGSGLRSGVVPYLIDTTMDLKGASDWWAHQLHWDQCNRAARPLAYLFSTVVRPVPFAVLYAISRLGDAVGLAVLAGAIILRLATSAGILGWGMRDREGLGSLWLLPLRDIAAMVSRLLAYTKRTTVWRGTRFTLTRGGKLVARESRPHGASRRP